jgi:hypothetical protein
MGIVTEPSGEVSADCGVTFVTPKEGDVESKEGEVEPNGGDVDACGSRACVAGSFGLDEGDADDEGDACGASASVSFLLSRSLIEGVSGAKFASVSCDTSAAGGDCARASASSCGVGAEAASSGA